MKFSQLKFNLVFLIVYFFCFTSVHAISDVQGYENVQTKELDANEFLENIIQHVNERRSFKGLLPLEKDEIVVSTASEQARNLIIKGYLSYYNSNQQGPDERYTLLGGSGALTEIVKGFEIDKKDDRKIKLTDLLARQLIEAISLNPDDSQILYSPYVTHIGSGFALSKDKNKFAVVIDFVTKSGNLQPLKPVLNWGEKLSVSGKIPPPFKFKAVSVAYFDQSKMSDVTFNNNEEESNDYYFDDENIKPYFPPQDFIAYSDTSKSNFVKIIKGLGVVGAIAGAPFTGGATAILAPAILNSIQNGPPREIPLKKGIKANSKGEFFGQIDLNYKGMGGLYFVSVLGELPGVDYPVVISRRTVRVNHPLQPQGES